jgi:hypothetical protein
MDRQGASSGSLPSVQGFGLVSLPVTSPALGGGFSEDSAERTTAWVPVERPVPDQEVSSSPKTLPRGNPGLGLVKGAHTTRPRCQPFPVDPRPWDCPAGSCSFLSGERRHV